ncbi:MAG: hypothetical protein HRT92_10060 [Piscirickettsiaceae bacterium]|nr:hypothetical protein [Piscirickettsiaceae bacterium]
MTTAHSLTKLIKKNKLSISPSSVFNLLTAAGVIEIREYASTTGSGVMKSYKHITDSYLDYGKNMGSVHEFKTEARFYEDSFQALIMIVFEQLSNEITAM